MKKVIVLILALSLIVALCGCGEQKPEEPADTRSDEVKQVERLISAIGEVSLERGKYITDAEQAYAALLEADKELVENAADLFAAREDYTVLLKQEADKVSQMISSIGTVTKNKEAVIFEAETAYEALPDEAKAMVENYEELTDAKYILDVLNQLFAAQEQGKTTLEIDGVKVSYVIDEDRWAVVENELTEEHEPTDLAYKKQTITWTGYYSLETEIPTGWSGEWYSSSNSGALYTNKDKTMAMYYWARLLGEREDLLSLNDPYQILETVAKEALNNQERGEFHKTIYAQRRALWCWASIDGTDSLCVFLLADSALFCVQAWRPDSVLNEQMIGIAVHSINHMSISPVN